MYYNLDCVLLQHADTRKARGADAWIKWWRESIIWKRTATRPAKRRDGSPRGVNRRLTPRNPPKVITRSIRFRYLVRDIAAAATRYKGLYLFRRAIEQEVEQAVIIRQSLIISSNRATKAHSHLLDSYPYSILCPIANWLQGKARTRMTAIAAKRLLHILPGESCISDAAMRTALHNCNRSQLRVAVV